MATRRSFRGFRVRNAVLGALLVVQAAAGPVRAAGPTTFVVTTGSDLAGATCGATCSLRQAINAANANVGATDLITFNVPGGPATISPTSALPDITDTVVIDGTSQPGTRLLGGSAGSSANGLHVLASGTVIRGLEIRSFARNGILLDGVHDAVIGGATAAEGNVLAGNGGDGVAVIGDSSAVNNQILANRIFGNGSLSIDLGDDNLLGLVGNSIGGSSGPNGLINGPSISPITPSATDVTIQVGRVASSSTARVDVFWSATCPIGADVTGLVPQAAEFLGSATSPQVPGVPGGPNQYAQVVFTLAPPRATGYVTATSTAAEGTSELSQCAIIQSPTDLTASAVVTPSTPVDVGTPVHIDLHIGNLGPAVHTDPFAGFALTSGAATFTTVTSSQGACAFVSPQAFCSLGAFGVGSAATVRLDLVPTAAGILDLEVAVIDLSGLDPDTAGDDFHVQVTVLAAESTAGTVSGGGTVSTDATEGDGATPTDPIETAVTLPPGAPTGTITIAEQPDATPPPFGFAFLGQASVITAPAQTAAHPLVFQFTLDGSILPADPVVIFRNGVPVPACTVANPGTDPSATPDPCFLPPQTIGDDLVLTVRTSAASTWRIGTRTPFSFTGFFAPVDNAGILNQVKAGQAIPVKFSLGGNRGLGIFAAGSPSSVGISCGNARVDPVEQTVTAGSSSLSYDAASDRYQYVWKTDKAWSGTCRRLVLAFADGSTATALFSFVK